MDGLIRPHVAEPYKLTVRFGAPSDIDEIMNLAMLGCEENGFAVPNVSKLLQEMWNALHLNRGMIGVVGPPDGKPEGAVLLSIHSPWYSDELVLEERAIFIHPDFRQAAGGRASRLCEFSKHAADRLKLPLLIGVLSNSRTEAKVRLYERHFGKMAGAFFLYRANTGGAVPNDG